MKHSDLLGTAQQVIDEVKAARKHRQQSLSVTLCCVTATGSKNLRATSDSDVLEWYATMATCPYGRMPDE